MLFYSVCCLVFFDVQLRMYTQEIQHSFPLTSCLRVIIVFMFAFIAQVLERMQKADKTKDDVYEEFVMNFKKQEVLKF